MWCSFRKHTLQACRKCRAWRARRPSQVFTALARIECEKWPSFSCRNSRVESPNTNGTTRDASSQWNWCSERKRWGPSTSTPQLTVGSGCFLPEPELLPTGKMEADSGRRPQLRPWPVEGRPGRNAEAPALEGQGTTPTSYILWARGRVDTSTRWQARPHHHCTRTLGEVRPFLCFQRCRVRPRDREVVPVGTTTAYVSDHQAVLLLMTPSQGPWRQESLWRLNTRLLKDEDVVKDVRAFFITAKLKTTTLDLRW